MNDDRKSASPDWPQSLAIAGAWGYIGRRFLDAALQLGIRPAVFDPGPLPADVSAHQVEHFTDENSFYRHPADLFHLALPPHARWRALRALIDRSQREPVSILNEKPMAAPEHPEHCRELIREVESSGALMLFDFLELFSPLTEAIVGYLKGHSRVVIHSIDMQRSKDREDPANLRNRKIITPIQFQESVHCLAWVLFLLARLRGNLAAACDDRLRISAESDPYLPPNPKDYAYVVDGRCRWQIDWGETRINGLTDFKRQAPWTKRRVVRGEADGRPFEIEAEYQEGSKRLVIDSIEQPIDPQANSYAQVIETFARWRREVGPAELLRGVYPNPRFAQVTFLLSSALWRAGYDRRTLSFATIDELLAFDAQFAAAVPRLGKYA